MFYAASRMKSFQNIYSEHNAVSYRNTQSFKSTLGQGRETAFSMLGDLSQMLS